MSLTAPPPLNVRAALALSPRSVPIVEIGVAGAAASVGGAALLWVMHWSWGAVATGVAGLALTYAAVVAGRVVNSRWDQTDNLVLAVAALLRIDPNRRLVTAARWGIGITPARLRIRYPRTVLEPGRFGKELRPAARSAFGAEYKVASVRHRSRVINLELDAAAPKGVGEQVRRATSVVTSLLGATASTSDFVYDDDGQLVGFQLGHDIGHRLVASGYRRRVEVTVSAMLAGRWRARWDLEHDTAVFSVRPNFPSNIWLPADIPASTADILASYDTVELHYGVDEDGRVCTWRPAIDPNLMVVGAPGTGKTVLLHNLVIQLANYLWPVWIVDGKSIEFLGFRDWPNVQLVASNIPDQVAVIERAFQVMSARYTLIENGQASETDFEPLMLILDEFAEFRARLKAWYSRIKVKGDPTVAPTLEQVASIARMGRSSRVHLIFATQRPDAEYFGGDMRDNFRHRISQGRLSPQGAQMMWENHTVGTTIPRGCRGRATAINDAGFPVEVQTYRTPDPRKTTPGTEEAALLDQLRPAVSLHPRLLVVPPKPEVDLDGDGLVMPLTFGDYAGADLAPAADRPDLDPLQTARNSSVDPRQLASPLAILGLVKNTSRPTQSVDARAGDTAAADNDPVGDDRSSDDPFFGYSDPTERLPSELAVGDLVLIDADAGLWATVEEPPEDDDGDIGIAWRADDDSRGYLTVPDDLVDVRVPLEYATEYTAV